MEKEKLDFDEYFEIKNTELDFIHDEWDEKSNSLQQKLAEAIQTKCELQYQLDEIKNSDEWMEFKEKR